MADVNIKEAATGSGDYGLGTLAPPVELRWQLESYSSDFGVGKPYSNVLRSEAEVREFVT